MADTSWIDEDLPQEPRDAWEAIEKAVEQHGEEVTGLTPFAYGAKPDESDSWTGPKPNS